MAKASQEDTSPEIARAVVSALDHLADRLPALLLIPDSRMIALETVIEKGLQAALRGRL